MNKPWHKFYDPNVPHTLVYEDYLIPDLIEKAAHSLPDRKALIFMDFSMTYAQLWKAVEQFTRALLHLGVTRGERVLIFMPNCPQFIIAYYAALRAGAIIVPANPLYGEQELAYQLHDAGAQTLITLDVVFSRVKKLLSDKQLQRVIIGRIQDYLPTLKRFIYRILKQKKTDNIGSDGKNGVFFFHKLLKKRYDQPGLPVVDIDDVAVLQYTGGTTGVIKGAMLSHRNIVYNLQQMRRYYHTIKDGKDIFVSVLPFFHSYGMALAMNMPLAAGATLLVFPQFQAGDILKAVVRYKATAFPGIPSIYSVLCSYKDIKKYDISSIRCCISGAAPLPVAVLQEFEKLTGGIILEGYGLSESSPVTHCNAVCGQRKVGSIGVPMPDTDCKIVDAETAEELPLGEVGELCIKGPQVMQGYWHKDEETRIALGDGWLFTGDIARMDEDGYFYIIERKKDMIISEGFNIYPREVEEVLLHHPAVADAAVIGVPDKLRGERVLAYVVLREGQKAAPDEIIKFCRENLVKYKVPKKIIQRDSIPTNIAGKKLRRILKQEAAESGVPKE